MPASLAAAVGDSLTAGIGCHNRIQRQAQQRLVALNGCITTHGERTPESMTECGPLLVLNIIMDKEQVLLYLTGAGPRIHGVKIG